MATPGTETAGGVRGAPGACHAQHRVSIIIPAYNAADDIAACLEALAPNVAAGMQLIVVDDSSTDATAAIARGMGAKVISTQGGNRGPSVARNLGAREASGDVLVFVDADVCVHPDTVARAVAALEEEPGLGAVTGAYDDQPSAPGNLSQWRNLLHCYTHRTARRDTKTFWTGFGAIRRELFENAGGLDETIRFLEDMDLGARLTRAGVRLRLDPSLAVQHRKEWTLWSMIRTDLIGRAIPYTRILLREGMDDDLNVRVSQRVSVALTWFAAGLLTLAPWIVWTLAGAAACVAGVALANAGFYRFLSQRRGYWFALRMFPCHLLFFFYSGLGYLFELTREAAPRLAREWGAPAAVFFVCALAFQWYAGAYQSDPYDADEPGHILTGLLVRDYLASGLERAPMEFARDYYAHYPRIALGHWPPLFYVVQAAWTLVAPATRASLLVLMAALTALVATCACRLVAYEFGRLAGWCAGFLLFTPPLVLWLGSRVYTEIPMALMNLGAMLTLARYLHSGRWQHSIVFGFWASASLLTKGTGIVLAPLPLIGVVLTRRWDLLRRGSFWLPAAVAAAVAGPWYLLAPGALHQKAAIFGAPGIVASRIELPTTIWAGQMGWVVSILVLAGLLRMAVRAARGPMSVVWAVAVGMVISASLFPLSFGVWELRHLVEAAPAFLLIAASGAWLITLGPVKAVPAKVRGATAVALVLLAAVWNPTIARQYPRGYGALAEAIVAGHAGRADSLLIVATVSGEGTLIAEIAQRERRPGRFILRATKLLADISWAGDEVTLRFQTPAQVHEFLRSIPLDLVVLDDSDPAPFGYASLLADALSEHPEVWDLWRPEGGRFRVFQRRDPDPLGEEERMRRLSGLAAAPSL